MKAIAVGMLVLALGRMGLVGEGRAEDKAPAEFSFTGQVVRVDLEGGFFGIRGKDGTQYDPINLAKDFQVNGLNVTVKAKVAEGMMSMRMWGTMIEILEIKRTAAN